MKRILATGCALLFAAAMMNCGDDEGGSGGATSQGGAGGEGGMTTTTTTTTTDQGGMGGMPNCMNDGMCEPMLEDCACSDCVSAPQCGFCTMDGQCTVDDACTCAECADDSYCSNPGNCMDDGFCDEFNEGCVCADCATATNCAGQIEDCGNGTDDNNNALVDCDDLNFCLNNPACAEICDNTTDDNGNGAIDCADVPYCTNSAPCVAAACATATAINLGDTTGDNTAGSQGIDAPCQYPGGHEVVYTYTPASDGFVVGTLVSTADLGFQVRTSCTDEATLTGCFDAVVGDEVGAFEVTAATPVTIIVDGYSPAEVSAFTLTLVQADNGGCIDDGVCHAEVGEGCACADCASDPVCGYCNPADAMCGLDEACTCDDCDTDAFCTDAANCSDDGFCDQFVEGCQCADCTGVPNCQ